MLTYNAAHNLLVVQSRPEQLLHGPLAWGGDWHTLTNAKAPTQLLLIQQPAMPAPSTAPPPSSSHTARPGHVKTGGSRSSSNNNNSSQSHSKSSYLPILNSYPRIAPHPRKDTHVSKTTTWVEGVKESGGEGQSQSKRVCTEEEKREAVSTTTHLLKPQQHQKEGRVHSSSQHKGRGGHSSFPSLSHCPVPGHVSSTTQHKSRHCQQSSVSNSVGSPSVSSTQTPSPPSSSDSSSSSSPPSSSPSSSTAHSPYRPAPDSSSARQKRFFNTAGILNQSGLLAITLRTKELLKQNAATEREIAQLRQHTHLLCQVAQANQSRCNDGSDSLEKLFQAMTESASYPNLDSNQLSALSSSSQQSKSRNEEDNEKDNNIRTIKTNGMVQVVSLHTLDDETSPPSPLFAPSPDAEETHNGDPLDALSSSVSLSFPESFNEQGKKTSRQEATDKDLSDLTMLPESSMHNDYFL